MQIKFTHCQFKNNTSLKTKIAIILFGLMLSSCKSCYCPEDGGISIESDEQKTDVALDDIVWVQEKQSNERPAVLARQKDELEEIVRRANQDAAIANRQRDEFETIARQANERAAVLARQKDEMEEISRRANQDVTIAKRQRDEAEEKARQANENAVFANKQAALANEESASARAQAAWWHEYTLDERQKLANEVEQIKK